MKIDGQCHCGYIRYEAEIDPEKVAICNCTDCQTLSGSAFRTVVPSNKGSFKLLKPRLCVDDTPERALKNHLSCHSEFGVTQILYANPCARYKQDNDQAAEPILNSALDQR